MKKIFLTIFFAAGIFVLWSHSEIVLSNRLYLDEPQVHKIEKGEYLSLLAKKYYGDPQRWRELALINRAPNPDHVEVGEEILVPASNKVAEISRARTLTQVNTLVGDQEKFAVRVPSVPMTDVAPATPTSTSAPQITGNGTLEPRDTAPVVDEPVSPGEKTAFPWIWLGIGAAVIALMIGFVMFRRRQSVDQNVEVEVKDEKQSRIDDFRPRRQYGDASPAKA